MATIGSVLITHCTIMKFIWILEFEFFKILFCCLNCIATDHYRVVETKLGAIRGVHRTSIIKKVPFFAFKGIPFAKPPVGDLRFKAPEPIGPWNPQILDATNHSSTCMHSSLTHFESEPNSEDCLYLNVYVPAESNPKAKFAVMFFIHGGAYFGYSGNEYLAGPDFLIEQNVILVTCNYRLGIFGFLSLDTPEYSGNMGLKDQQMALKWTYDNIERFGGNNKRITVFGESAGGASTHFQVLSSESRKYMNNAIILSGTVHSPWAFSLENNHLSAANKIADEMGAPDSSLEDLIMLLKNVTSDSLSDYIFLDVFMESFRIMFAPVIERKDAVRPFICETPDEIYESKEVTTDVIFYHTSMEAQIFGVLYEKFNGNYEPDNEVPLHVLSSGNLTSDSEDYKKLAKLTRQFYLRDDDLLITKQTFPKYVEYLTDFNFIYPTQKSINLHRKGARTFYMQFSVNSSLNAFKRRIEFTDLPGASHADETCYIFYGDVCKEYFSEVMANKDSAESEVSLRTIEYLTKLFTNFAKYGDPTHKGDLIPSFNAIQGPNLNYLDVTNEGLKLGINPRQTAIEFWNRLEKQARRLMNDQKM